MIRLLTAVLLLTYSLFGWASAYPVDYDNMINHNNGDIIKAEDFNNNNNIHKQNIINLKESIDAIEAGTGPQGPQGPQGEQGPAGPQGEQGPSGADGIAAGLNCTTDQIIKWDGSAWVCADMPSAGNVVEDGAAYGSPVWVDLNGTVLTGRDNGKTVFILNGAFQLPGRIENDGTYRNETNYAYYLQSGCQGAAYSYANASAFVALPGSPNWQVRSGIAGDITYRSRLKISSNSCEEQEPYTSDVYQELLDSGIPAPSWLTNGTEAFRGLR